MRFTEGTDTAFHDKDPGLDLNETFRRISTITDLDEQAKAIAEAVARINAVLWKMETGEGVASARILPQGFFIAFRATRVAHFGRKGTNRVTMYCLCRPANAAEHQKDAGLRTAEDPYFARDFTSSNDGSRLIRDYLDAQLPEANWCRWKTIYKAMKVSPRTV